MNYDLCESYNQEVKYERCTLHESCCKVETEGETCEDFVEILMVDMTKIDEERWNKTDHRKLCALRGQHYEPVFKDEVKGMF